MPPAPTGTISVNEQGPYHWGDTLTFTTTGGKGRGHPMVEVALYQDVDEDGTVEDGLSGADLAFLTLNAPGQAVILRTGEGTQVDASKPAVGRVRLLQYAWKGGQESITELDRVEIDVVV